MLAKNQTGSLGEWLRVRSNFNRRRSHKVLSTFDMLLSDDLLIDVRLYRVLVFPGPRFFAWPPILALASPAPYPSSDPQFVFTDPDLVYAFTDPGPQFVFTGPGPQSIFTGPGPQFVLNGPSPQFVFTAPGPKFAFTAPGLQFYYQSGAWIFHIPILSPQFVFVFTVLAYDLYYRSGTWICIYLIIGSNSSGTCNSSSNFFGIDSTNICMPISGK